MVYVLADPNVPPGSYGCGDPGDLDGVGQPPWRLGIKEPVALRIKEPVECWVGIAADPVDPETGEPLPGWGPGGKPQEFYPTKLPVFTAPVEGEPPASPMAGIPEIAPVSGYGGGSPYDMVE